MLVAQPRGVSLPSVALLVLVAVSAFAQTDTGRISGSVFDPTGAVVPGASVVVTDVDRGTSRNLTTNAAGEYLAPNLLAGQYTIRASASGFKTIERRDVRVEVASDVRVDLSLQTGETQTTVTVSGEVAPVETTSGVLGGTISNQLIQELPVQGRNFQKLLELRPGTYLQPGSGKWSLASNGMRREHNEYILDGMDTVEGFCHKASSTRPRFSAMRPPSFRLTLSRSSIPNRFRKRNTDGNLEPS